MTDERLDDEDVAFARKFLDMIGVSEGDEALAAAAIDRLFDEIDYSRQDRELLRSDPRDELRDAQRAVETSITCLSDNLLKNHWRAEIANHLLSLERHFAERDGPNFEPLRITGSVRYAVWDLKAHLEVLTRVINAEIAKAEANKKARARRPREDWKRESMFACVWIAYELRRQAGVSDPVPNMKNGALAPLCGFAIASMKLAEATAEKYARAAAALVGRVHNGTLSGEDRRFLCAARWSVIKNLHGELAAIADPDDYAGERYARVPDERDPDPILDLRLRAAL